MHHITWKESGDMGGCVYTQKHKWLVEAGISPEAQELAFFLRSRKVSQPLIVLPLLVVWCFEVVKVGKQIDVIVQRVFNQMFFWLQNCWVVRFRVLRAPTARYVAKFLAAL